MSQAEKWENKEVSLVAYALINKDNKLVRLGYTAHDFEGSMLDGDRIVELTPATPTMVKPAVKRQK